MAFFPKIIRLLPIFPETKLELRRAWLERTYAREISAARKNNDNVKVASLENDRRFELDLHDEEDDALITKALLSKARRLRVPIPHRYNEDKSESVYWYEGRYTFTWCLTNQGIAVLREEIRKELKANHEARTYWVFWINSIMGVTGSITGLVALLGHKLF